MPLGNYVVYFRILNFNWNKTKFCNLRQEIKASFNHDRSHFSTDPLHNFPYLSILASCDRFIPKMEYLWLALSYLGPPSLFSVRWLVSLVYYQASQTKAVVICYSGSEF